MWAAWWGVMAWMAVRTFPGDGWGQWAAPWMAWAMPCAMFALAAANRWPERGKLVLVRAVAVSGFAEAALMFCQRWGWDPLWGTMTAEMEYAPERMIGTVGYQNQAAEFLGLAVVCTVCGWRGRWRWVACGGLVSVLVLTANRGAVAGAAAAGVAMVLVAGWGRFRVRMPSGKSLACAAAAVVLAALAVASIPEMRHRLADLARPGRSVAVQSRLWMARVAMAMWREHPWAGAGGGAYGRGYLDCLGGLLPGTKEHRVLEAIVYAREAHCDILQYGAEFGVAGLALLAVLAWMVARRASRADEPDRRGAAGVAAFMGVASLVSFSWQTTLAGPLAGLLLGMWCGEDGEAGPPRKAARANAWGLSAWALWLFALACLEAARSLGIPGIPLRGPSLAGEAGRLHGEGRMEEAARMFELAARDTPSPAVLRDYGATLAALERWEEAVAVYGRWVRSGMFLDEALWNLSVSLERTGRLADALAEEEERFRLFPNLFTGDQLYRLAVLYLRTGDPGATLRIAEDWQQRCEMANPDRWTPEWDNLSGSAWAASGEPGRARAFYEHALERAPGMESARRNLEALGE
jgi:tetratricopeptide (TPR) repeat protein